jgi:predicted RNA binding protein YcfA (HicA-like mRNA interferase family)
VPKKYREVKAIMSRAGWTLHRQAKGSHEQWISPDGARRVTIAGGGKDNRQVPPMTLGSIRRATGLEELR